MFFMKMSPSTKNCVLYGGKIIMKSRRFLSDVKKLYGELFELHQFSDVQAEMMLHGKNDISQRSSYIKGIYDCMLGTGDAIINTWLTSNLSLSDIASIKGQNTNTLKSRKYYLDKMLAEHANYKDSNILFYVVTAEFITEEEWRELNRRLASLSHKLYPNKNIRKQLLINIPTNEMETQLTEKEYKDFINILRPYVISSRRKAQQQINKMRNAAGYFNYLITNTYSLSDIDIQRKADLLLLFNGDEQIQYQEHIKEQETIVIDANREWVKPFGKYYDELNEDEKQKYLYGRPKRVKF